MPHIWTLQSQYLAKKPVVLSTIGVTTCVALFAAGWALNHFTNREKVRMRKTLGDCTIWGQKPKFLEATYKTADGKTHHSKLLYSGTVQRCLLILYNSFMLT